MSATGMVSMRVAHVAALAASLTLALLVAMPAAAEETASAPEAPDSSVDDTTAFENDTYERGRSLFAQCSRCHELDPLRANRIGPNLFSILGRPAAALQDFRYSQGMRAAAQDGLVWSRDALDRFIADPRSVVRRTSMNYRGMEDATARADLVTFLTGVTPGEYAPQTPVATDGAATEIGAAAMALEGDAAYGEYLSGECVTCHQETGANEGIPGIVGWPRDAFIRALFEYKTNVRSHQVMQLVTSNLGDEEIAALAAYFEQLGE